MMASQSTWRCGAAVAALLVPIAAHAQDMQGEIVVTAQKREQKLQDVGVSVTALGADQLRALGITDSKDIAKVVPGVTLDSTSGGGLNAQLTVRGISQSDYSAVQESPNSIYIDDVYISSSYAASFPLYDLQRIEVLRGPQGTLFGRASSGGLANFITARPTKDWEGYAELGFGSYDSAHAEGAISGPISDRVRFRLSGRTETANGYVHNLTGQDIFASAFYGIRGQIEADLTDSLTARLSIGYDRSPRHAEGTYKAAPYYLVGGQPTPLPANVDAYGTGPGNDFAGYRDTIKDAHDGRFNNVGFTQNRRFSPTLNLAWKLGGATITSITNFTKFDMTHNEDCDGGPLDYCQYPVAQHMKQLSEELRINGETGPLTYTAGIYYLHIKQSAPIGFSLPAISGSDFAFDDTNLVHQTTRSYAAFAQGEYAVTRKLKLTVGARFTRDEKNFDSKLYFNELGNGYSGGTGSTVYSPPILAYDFSTATVGNVARARNNMWSGKVQLDYKANRNTLFYASVSRGVKGAGFNTNVSGNLTLAATPFKSEYLYAYEAGAKFEFLDRKVRLNLSAFDYDYHRFQGYAFTGLQGVVGNYNGYFRGGEVELDATPLHGLNFNIGASYLRSKLHDVPTAYDGVRDERGVEAPTWTVNGSVSKSFEVGPGKMILIWSANYLGDRYASIDNNPATFVKGSFVHNARISYDLASGLELSAFVDNIGNVDRQTYVFDFITTTGSILRSYDKPRWIGASVRKTF